MITSQGEKFSKVSLIECELESIYTNANMVAAKSTTLNIQPLIDAGTKKAKYLQNLLGLNQ